MKRIALAVALVVMAAAACKRAEQRSTADSARMDTTHMMGDTVKMRTDTARMDTTRTTPPRRP